MKLLSILILGAISLAATAPAEPPETQTTRGFCGASFQLASLNHASWKLAPRPTPGPAAFAAFHPEARADIKEKRPRVVFEVTTAGTEQWTALLNNVENLRAALGNSTQIEVVAHGRGLGLLVAKGNTLGERMKNLSAAGVIFAACQNTMKRQRISQDQLLPFAVTVDSGVAEVVRKQEGGWSYIKSGI